MAQANPDDLNLNTGQAKKDPGPIPLGNTGPTGTEISHSPLNLGGGGDSAPTVAPRPAPAAPKPAAPPARPVATAAPVAPRPAAARPVAAGPQQPAAPGARITRVKIFFTKLHAGALDFMTEQITAWLAANPDVVVKRTNMVVGEIAAKVTEQNLIISIWY